MGLFGSLNIDKMIRKEDHQSLVCALGHKNEAVRIRAVEGLQQLGFPSKSYFVPVLNLVEHDPSKRVKAAALAVVERESFRLTGLLRDGIQDEVYLALCVLGKIEDQSFIDQILNATKHENEVIRQRAAVALGRHATDETARKLLDLADNDPHPVVRVTAVSSLSGISGKLRDMHIRKAVECALEDYKNP